jgi:hypothetical protein
MADLEYDPITPVKPFVMSEEEQARGLRQSGASGFLQVAELLGNDVKALKAIKEEAKFIAAHLDLPRGDEFAAKVRGWLLANKLEWT